MSSIGSYSFFRMTGAVEPARTRVEILERAGVDGEAYRDLGSGAPDSVLRTETLVSSLAAAKTAIDSYAGYIGTTQTVTDDLGNTRTSVMILDVRLADQRQLFYAQCTKSGMPAAPVAMLLCDWIVRADT